MTGVDYWCAVYGGTIEHCVATCRYCTKSDWVVEPAHLLSYISTIRVHLYTHKYWPAFRPCFGQNTCFVLFSLHVHFALHSVLSPPTVLSLIYLPIAPQSHSDDLCSTFDCFVIIYPFVSLCLGKALNQTYLDCYSCPVPNLGSLCSTLLCLYSFFFVIKSPAHEFRPTCWVLTATWRR